MQNSEQTLNDKIKSLNGELKISQADVDNLHESMSDKIKELENCKNKINDLEEDLSEISRRKNNDVNRILNEAHKKSTLLQIELKRVEQENDYLKFNLNCNNNAEIKDTHFFDPKHTSNGNKNSLNKGLSLILSWLRSKKEGQEDIMICMFSFTKTEIRDCLNEGNGNCKIQVLVYLHPETPNESTWKSFNNVRALNKDRVEVRFLIQHNFMHHKFAVCGDEFINGSLNWTQAIKNNNENILIIRSKETAKKFRSEFQKLWVRSCMERAKLDEIIEIYKSWKPSKINFYQ